METRLLIAANVRARLGWLGKNATELQLAMGWSRKTTYNRLHGVTAFSGDELDQVATFLECEPGDFYNVPVGFSSPSASSNSAIAA